MARGCFCSSVARYKSAIPPVLTNSCNSYGPNCSGKLMLNPASFIWSLWRLSELSASCLFFAGLEIHRPFDFGHGHHVKRRGQSLNIESARLGFFGGDGDFCFSTGAANV